VILPSAERSFNNFRIVNIPGVDLHVIPVNYPDRLPKRTDLDERQSITQCANNDRSKPPVGPSSGVWIAPLFEYRTIMVVFYIHFALHFRT